MDISGSEWHSLTVFAAAGLGPLGCLLAIWYAARPDHRDTWRYPMLIGATLATVSILAAYVTGDWLLDTSSVLAADPQVGAHREYAERLLLPTIGFFVMAILAGWLNPQTGALRLMLPLLLAGFALAVLVLVVFSGDAGARSLWESIVDQF